MDRYSHTNHTLPDNNRLTAGAMARSADGNPGSGSAGGNAVATLPTRAHARGTQPSPEQAQRLVLAGEVWACSWCAAPLHNSVIIHRDDCRWLAEIAAAEREHMQAGLYDLLMGPVWRWAMSMVPDAK